MDTQQLAAQKGEIEFRKKLYQQQVEGKKVLDDEFDASGIETLLVEKMSTTIGQMNVLLERHLVSSPYLEIGAERCQRSLVMENDLGLHGAAIDISFEMLRSCSHYQHVFHKAKSPIRICCDANTLPFMTGSIRFVFCYETLHHFPEPAPIAKEIHRVLLPGGSFFFNEEPYKRLFHINLYKGTNVYSEKTLKRSKLRKVFDHFLCERSCNEVEHGIIENEDITLSSWKQALLPFEERDVTLTAGGVIHSDLFAPASHTKYFAASLLGGQISGICRKLTGNGKPNLSIYDALICPSCRKTGSEVLLNRENSLFRCPTCSQKFPVVDEVLFLFSQDKLAELYPEISASLQYSPNG